jgi:hypothetical protein
MRKAIPNPIPANNPLAGDGLLTERKRKRINKEVKNRPLVWDIIVEDMSKSQIEAAPKTEAKIPAFLS